MRVEHDVKLTFDDVLIRPKRSTLVSRSDVTLEREFSFRHSDATWKGVPIVAANMDTTGLFDVARVLQDHGMLTCLQKFYSTSACAEKGKKGGRATSEVRGNHLRRFSSAEAVLRLQGLLDLFVVELCVQ